MEEIIYKRELFCLEIKHKHNEKAKAIQDEIGGELLEKDTIHSLVSIYKYNPEFISNFILTAKTKHPDFFYKLDMGEGQIKSALHNRANCFLSIIGQSIEKSPYLLQNFPAWLNTNDAPNDEFWKTVIQIYEKQKGKTFFHSIIIDDKFEKIRFGEAEFLYSNMTSAEKETLANHVFNKEAMLERNPNNQEKNKHAQFGSIILNASFIKNGGELTEKDQKKSALFVKHVRGANLMSFVFNYPDLFAGGIHLEPSAFEDLFITSFNSNKKSQFVKLFFNENNKKMSERCMKSFKQEQNIALLEKLVISEKNEQRRTIKTL